MSGQDYWPIRHDQPYPARRSRLAWEFGNSPSPAPAVSTSPAQPDLPDLYQGTDLPSTGAHDARQGPGLSGASAGHESILAETQSMSFVRVNSRYRLSDSESSTSVPSRSGGPSSITQETLSGVAAAMLITLLAPCDIPTKAMRPSDKSRTKRSSPGHHVQSTGAPRKVQSPCGRIGSPDICY